MLCVHQFAGSVTPVQQTDYPSAAAEKRCATGLLTVLEGRDDVPEDANSGRKEAGNCRMLECF